MSLFPYAIGKLQGILQFLPGKDAGLVETFRQKSLADRTGMPLSHQRHIVAAAGGIGSEFVIVLLLGIPQLHHTGRDQNPHALEHGQGLYRRLRSHRIGIVSVVNDRHIPLLPHLQTVRHRLQPAHRHFQFLQRDSHTVGYRDGPHQIDYVVAADEPGLVAGLLPLGGNHGKIRPQLADADILRIVSALPLLLGRIENPVGIAVTVIGNVGAVSVQKQRPMVRQRVRQLELRVNDIFHGKERLQMLGSDGGNDTPVRVHHIADLLDIPHMAGAHLTEKDLMVRPQMFPDRPNHAHGRVETLRRHQHAVTGLQQCLQIKLHAGLSVASRDTDDFHIRHLPQTAQSVIYKVLIDGLLHRAV